jgi:hypothetical protein
MYTPENVRIVLKGSDAADSEHVTVVSMPSPKSEPNLESAFVFPNIGNERRERDTSERELAVVLSPFK